jgi:hypothetical protein
MDEESIILHHTVNAARTTRQNLCRLQNTLFIGKVAYGDHVPIVDTLFENYSHPLQPDQPANVTRAGLSQFDLTCP